MSPKPAERPQGAAAGRSRSRAAAKSWTASDILRHFATHPAHLRKGIARLLLEQCLAEARAAGVRTMMCQSTLPAEPFYAAAGFRRIGVIEIEMAPGVLLPAVEMQRPIC
jgi:GNAT superfamily N-acetyltransferase